MSKSWETLKKRLEAALGENAPHGAVADFCRKTGFARTSVQNWLERSQSPKVENLDRIADALGVPPWELLRPEGAQPRVERVEHHLAECYRRVAEDAGKRAQAPAPEPRAGEAGGDPLAGLSAAGRRKIEALIENEKEAEKALVDAEKSTK